MQKSCGHHTHDRVHVAIEAHFSPDDVGVRTVIAAPKAVADNHRLQESRDSILRYVDAAKLRLCSQQNKVIGTGNQTFGTDRPLSTTDRRIARRDCRDFLKNARTILQIPKFRCGHSYILLVWATKVVEDAHELVRMRERQRAQQYGVN